MKIPFARSSRKSVLPWQWMKRDWDLRARENALYYIDCGHGESEESFWASGGKDLDDLILQHIKLGRSSVAVEIGCGIGRILRPLAARVSLVYGVDISKEMIRLARRALAGIPNVRVFRTKGTLRKNREASCDFVYSYIVFQHIPLKSAVSAYIREAARILKGGGLFRFQVDGRAPEESRNADTWCGVRYTSAEIRREVESAGFDIIGLTGEETQYMWVTARRRRETGRPESASVLFLSTVWNEEPLRRLCQRLGLDPAQNVPRILAGETSIRNLAGRFLAENMALSPEDFVRRAYQVFLDRDPDEGGRAFYTREIEQGIARDNVVDCLVSSPEFEAKHRKKQD